MLKIVDQSRCTAGAKARKLMSVEIVAELHHRNNI